MKAPSIVSARLSETRLEPAPIRAEWILEGAPQARAAELSRSADGAAMTAVWDCTAGAFNWYFGCDETVHILDGEVVVDGGGGARVLRPGDVALFRAGTWAHWHVPHYVRKLAFCHDALPRPVSLWFRATRKLGRLRRKLFGEPAMAAGALTRGAGGRAKPAGYAGGWASPPLLSRFSLFALRTASFSFGFVL